MRRHIFIATVGIFVAVMLALLVWRPAIRADRTVVIRGPETARPAAPTGAPHVVLVIGCTVRKDQVGTYGGMAGVTPFLDRLAAEGTVLEDVITAAPWTRAAAAAILTGRHAVSLGLVEPGSMRNERILSDDASTLAERMQAGGWTTIGFTANPNLNAVFGFDQGFDQYKQMPHLWREDGVKLSTRSALHGLLALVDEAPSERPVFLQVLLIDAHAPYVAHAEDAAPWREAGVPERVAAYRAGLHRFDGAVERLWEGLSARGWTREDTLFLVLNDHGEGLSFPPNQGKGHGRFLAPATVGGVWISWGREVAAGHRVQGIASQVDLVPTLVEFLDLPGAYDGPGQSLAAPVRGASARTGGAYAFTDTWFLDSDRAAVYTPAHACQRSFSGGRAAAFPDGCFDRIADPAHEAPAPDAELEAVLVDWRAARVLEQAATTSQIAPDDEARDRQLEALGYLEGPVPDRISPTALDAAP